LKFDGVTLNYKNRLKLNFYERAHLQFEGMLAYTILRLRFVNTIYLAAHYVRYGYITVDGAAVHDPFHKLNLSELVEFISLGYYFIHVIYNKLHHFTQFGLHNNNMQ
jgi:hypothetical protein